MSELRSSPTVRTETVKNQKEAKAKGIGKAGR